MGYRIRHDRSVDVELRNWRATDAEGLLTAVAESPDLATQLPVGDLTSVASCREFIVAHLVPNGSLARSFAIVRDGMAVGNLGISNIDRAHDTAWVHYWLATSSRGAGLASRGLAAGAAWAFDELGLFRLELGHRVNNPASCRVATAAGFIPEGIERSKLRYGDERFDVETHARLRTDPIPMIAALSMHT